jgi:branched-chain amino acid transport system permease protein
VINLELFNQLLVSGVIVGSTYALVAVSFGIIYSTTRIFHLAHSVVYAVAAYAAVLTHSTLGVSLWLSLPAGLLAAVLLGTATELLLYRPLRRRSGTVLAFFLVSLGVTIAGPNLLQIGFGPENRRLPGFPVRTISLGNVTFTTLDLTAVIVSWLLIAVLLAFLHRTTYGRAITATRTNRQMAMAVGIPVDRIVLIVFALG